MERLVLEIRDAHRRFVGYQVIEKFPATVGRAYDNDVILSDPYVHPHHLRIDHLEAGWQVDDVSEEAGLSVAAQYDSGSEIVVGKTHLRLFAADHPVDEARHIHGAPVMDVLRSVSLGISLILALVFSFSVYHYQEMTEQLMWGKLIADSLPLVGAALFWAGTWSLLAYVVRRHLYFHYFLLVTVGYLVLDILLESLAGVVAFNVNNAGISEALSYFTGGILLVFLFYASMHQSFTISRKRKWFLANMFSWGLVAVVIFAVFANYPEFRRNPEYPTELKPPMMRLVGAESLDAFLAETEILLNDFEE